MRHSPLQRARQYQKGGIDGKLILLVAGLIVGFMIKSTLFPPIKGQSESSLMGRFGQPVAKHTVPRPR